jgi:hypothetical protein
MFLSLLLDSMSRPNELVFNGPVTAFEIDELSNLLGNDELEVQHYDVKGHGVKELIDIIFNDFNTIVFARDLLVGKAFEESYKVLVAAFQYLTKKGKKVESISAERDFLTVDGKSFRIQIITRPEQVANLVIHINSIPKDELIPKGDDNNVTVLIDEKGRITINVM